MALKAGHRNKAGVGIFHLRDIVEHHTDNEPPLRGEVVEIGESQLRIFDVQAPPGSRNLFYVNAGSCVRVERK